MSLLRYRAALSVGLTLLAVLASWLAGLAYIAEKSAIGDEILAGIEPRHARLAGMLASSTEIERSLVQARAALARKAYPATQPLDRIGPDLQQKLRTAAEASGVNVSGSQIAATTAVGEGDAGADIVQVLLTVDALPDQLLAMFDTVSAQSPAMYVDMLQLQPAGRTAPGRLTARVRFSALRVRK